MDTVVHLWPIALPLAYVLGVVGFAVYACVTAKPDPWDGQRGDHDQRGWLS